MKKDREYIRKITRYSQYYAWYYKKSVLDDNLKLKREELLLDKEFRMGMSKEAVDELLAKDSEFQFYINKEKSSFRSMLFINEPITEIKDGFVFTEKKAYKLINMDGFFYNNKTRKKKQLSNINGQ